MSLLEIPQGESLCSTSLEKQQPPLGLEVDAVAGIQHSSDGKLLAIYLVKREYLLSIASTTRESLREVAECGCNVVAMCSQNSLIAVERRMEGLRSGTTSQERK